MALTLLQAVAGGLGVLYALLLRNIVDSAVSRDSQAFSYYVSLIIGLVIIRLFIAAILRWLNEQARSDIENLFKGRLADSILRRDYSLVSDTHSAEWMNRLTNDTVVVANGFVEILPGLIGMFVRLLSATVMIILLDRWFAIILIPGGIALVLLTYIFRRVLKRLHKNIQEKDGLLRIFLQERIGSLMVIKSFVAEEEALSDVDRKMSEHKKARMKRNAFSNVCNIGFGAAMEGMYLIGAVYCAYGIMTGRVTYGTLTAILHLIGQVQSPFANISGYLPRYYAMIASAERLMEIEQYEEDVKPASAEDIHAFYENEFESLGFRDASFSYHSESNEKTPIVLENLTLDIRKGEYIAFMGHSGCGKSTVLKLLLCMYPLNSGHRYINDCELTSVYRRLFAYVPQGNVLMNGTIREVVSFAAPSQTYDEEKLNFALKVACADEFVEDLDEVLGERGSGLSEGQMQRIAIARAIFSDAPILLLDEATSALDEATELKLIHNLQSLTDRTVVIVTHRKAVTAITDKVIEFSS